MGSFVAGDFASLESVNALGAFMKNAVFYRSPGNYDVDEASDEAAEYNDEPSLTVQSQTEDTDINVLMKRYGLTGVMPENMRLPSYGDYEGITSFRDAIQAVRDAEESFMTMPAATRARFENDPQKFLEYVNDEKNGEELIKLGLRKAPEPVVEVKPTEVIIKGGKLDV